MDRSAKMRNFLFLAAFVKRMPVFLRLSDENRISCLLQSAFSSISKPLTEAWRSHFRQVLIHHVQADYFQNMTYHKLPNEDGRIINPEQQIARNVHAFNLKFMRDAPVI